VKVLPLIGMIPTLFFACYLLFAPVLIHTTADSTRGPIHATVSIFFFARPGPLKLGKYHRQAIYGIMGSAGFIVLYYVVLQDLHGFTALCNLSVFSFAINCGILEHVELGQFRALPSVTLE
jgi:hypothetical protein